MRTPQRRFALIRRYVLGVLLLVPLLFAQGAQPQAAVVNFDGSGDVTSIDGLMVDGQTFDILFVLGTYNTVLGPALFPNAAAIRDAIQIELNPTGPLSAVIDAPNLAVALAFSNLFAIPSQISSALSFGSPFGVDTFGSQRVEVGEGFFTPERWVPFDSFRGFTESNVSWAVPTLISSVPLPAALPLFGSALAMLGIVGWRRRRQSG